MKNKGKSHLKQFLSFLRQEFFSNKKILFIILLLVVTIFGQFFQLFNYVLVMLLVVLFFYMVKKIKEEDGDLLKPELNKELIELEEELDEVNKKILYITNKFNHNVKVKKWLLPKETANYDSLTEEDLKDLKTQRIFLMKKIENKRNEIYQKISDSKF